MATVCYNQVGCKLASYAPAGDRITCAIPPPSTYLREHCSGTISVKTNEDGLVARVTQPGNRTTSHYDADRNLSSSTDGEGNTMI